MRVAHIIEPGVTNTQWVEIINFCNSILKLNLFGFLATSVDALFKWKDFLNKFHTVSFFKFHHKGFKGFKTTLLWCYILLLFNLDALNWWRKNLKKIKAFLLELTKTNEINFVKINFSLKITWFLFAWKSNGLDSTLLLMHLMQIQEKLLKSAKERRLLWIENKNAPSELTSPHCIKVCIPFYMPNKRNLWNNQWI